MTLKVFVIKLNFSLKKKIKNNLDAYISRRKKYIHIAFDRPLLSIKNRAKILDLILRK